MDINTLKLFKNIGVYGKSKIDKEIYKGIKTYNEALDNMVYDFYVRVGSKEAKDIYVNFDYNNPIKGLTGLSKRQTASADMETYLRVFPNTLKRGDYVQFSFNEWDNWHESIYLITSDVEREEVNDKVVFLKCNTSLKWQGLKGTRYEKWGFPCVSSNDSYGSKTLLTNDFLSYQDTKLKILVQANEYTKNIQKNWRFMFGNSDTDIFEIIDITRSLEQGIITLIAKKVEKITEDNIEMNLAYNEKDTVLDKDKPDIIYHIDGEEVIPLNETRGYRLVDNNGTVINLADLTFEVNDESLASLTESLSEGLSEDLPEEKVIETIYLKCLVEKEVVTLVIKRDDIVLAKKNIYLGEEW